MKRFFSEAFGLTISKVLVTTISMVYTMLLSRFRTLEDYGTYSELLIIVNIVSTVFFLGMPYSVNFFLPRRESREEQKEFIDTYISTVLSIGVFAGLLIVILIPLWENYFSNNNISTYWFFLLFFPLTRILNNGADNIFVIFHKIRLLIAFRTCHSLFQLISVVLIEISHQSFKIYMVLYTALEVTFSIIVVIFIKNQVGGFKYHVDTILLKKILAFSLPLGLSSAVGAVNVEMDKLIIGHFLSTDEIAIYANASKEIPVSVLAASFTTVLIPKLSKMIKDGEYRKATKMWNHVTLFSFTIIVFFVFFFICHAREMLVILYSDKYLPGYLIFIIYSIALIFQSTYFGIFLNVTGKTKYIFFGSLISMLSNVVLNITFFMLFGFWGPALSTLLCTTILALYQLLMTSKVIKMKVRDIFTIRLYVYPVLSVAFIAALYECLKRYLGLQTLSLTQTIISGATWFLLYACINLNRIKRIMSELNNIS